MFRALLSCDTGLPSCLVNRLARQIYNAVISFCIDPGPPSLTLGINLRSWVKKTSEERLWKACLNGKELCNGLAGGK